MLLPNDDQHPVWLARVTEDGMLEYVAPYELQAYLNRWAGRMMDVAMWPHSTRRSQRQNRWWFGIFIPALANDLGWDRHDRMKLHYALVSLCFGTTFDERLGIDVPNVRSSGLNTREFSTLMEWGVRYAAETHHCYILMPDDLLAKQKDTTDET